MQSLCRLREDAPPLGLFRKNVQTMMISCCHKPAETDPILALQVLLAFSLWNIRTKVLRVPQGSDQSEKGSKRTVVLLCDFPSVLDRTLLERT